MKQLLCARFLVFVRPFELPHKGPIADSKYSSTTGSLGTTRGYVVAGRWQLLRNELWPCGTACLTGNSPINICAKYYPYQVRVYLLFGSPCPALSAKKHRRKLKIMRRRLENQKGRLLFNSKKQNETGKRLSPASNTVQDT